ETSSGCAAHRCTADRTRRHGFRRLRARLWRARACVPDAGRRPDHAGTGMEDGLPVQCRSDQRCFRPRLFNRAPGRTPTCTASADGGRRAELMSLEVLILLVVFVGLLVLNVPVAVCI